MNETLLKQVKHKLNITWSDTDTDDRVLDIISQAKAVMLHKIGITDKAFDFSESGIVNVLFLSYCLYLYNHCENEFEDNYLSDLLQARAIYEVEQNENISKV